MAATLLYLLYFCLCRTIGDAFPGFVCPRVMLPCDEIALSELKRLLAHEDSIRQPSEGDTLSSGLLKSKKCCWIDSSS
jgi:hypothetical protein